MQWVAPNQQRKKKFEESHVLKFHTLRFRRRSDLLGFHAKYPGGLAAQLLAQIRQKLGQGLPASSTELMATDPGAWAARDGAMKDVRDQKELMLLSRVLVDLAHDRLPQLADVVTTRIRELRAAKADGSSWEKAGALSLQPGPYSGSAQLPEAAFHL